ncbi:MAG: hypothetical protein AAFY26_26020, partial [Cyanobacteria bacterium J06638_22]
CAFKCFLIFLVMMMLIIIITKNKSEGVLLCQGGLPLKTLSRIVCCERERARKNCRNSRLSTGIQKPALILELKSKSILELKKGPLLV